MTEPQVLRYRIAANVRYYMRKADINQKTLSQRSGVGQASISKLLNDNVAEAKITTVYLLAQALEVTVDDLLQQTPTA